jgi:hypothetical protein
VCYVERCAVGRLWGHGYGVREGKVCVQDIHMELSDVMLGKVLRRYVDTICRV